MSKLTSQVLTNSLWNVMFDFWLLVEVFHRQSELEFSWFLAWFLIVICSKSKDLTLNSSVLTSLPYFFVDLQLESLQFYSLELLTLVDSIWRVLSRFVFFYDLSFCWICEKNNWEICLSRQSSERAGWAFFISSRSDSLSLMNPPKK